MESPNTEARMRSSPSPLELGLKGLVLVHHGRARGVADIGEEITKVRSGDIRGA